jgi:gliding motility-associated lipoprotein GldH
MKKFFLIISTLVVIISIQSCKNKEDIIYQKEYLLNNNLWSKDSTLKFSFDINDTSKLYSCILKIKLDSKYTFNKFIFSTKLQTPDGSYRQSGFETQIDENYKQNNLIKEEQAILIKNEIYKGIKFKEKGRYLIEVSQNLPQDIFYVKSVEIKIIQKNK